MKARSPLSRLPAVGRLVQHPEVEALLAEYRREAVTGWLNEALAGLREDIGAGGVPAGASREELVRRVLDRVAARRRAIEANGVRRVINATGVVIHTNLGRAPLPAHVLAGLPGALQGYTDLEFDLAAGGRGHRDAAVARLCRELLPCQDATAVNNNAGALLLILAALADGGDVLVSRGELVEIGGSFRIPEIMAQSGARLREVGTTNRTRVGDYAASMSERTRLILQVHRSNFEIVGFTEAPSVHELLELSGRSGVPLVVDAGSGFLFPLPGLPIRNEPVIQPLLAEGVPLVCFSGDKLLGGPQAGLILGRADLVERVRRHPLMRALRLDKVALYLLAETLKLYFRKDPADRLPHFNMIAADPVALRRRCLALRRRAVAAAPSLAGVMTVETGHSLIGGGSTPGQMLPGPCLSLRLPADRLAAFERRLRAGRPPVLGRLAEDRFWLDLRTVARAEEPAVVGALIDAAAAVLD
jgi:L-seryl-tRNA(Ser) seleniumtransferase